VSLEIQIWPYVQVNTSYTIRFVGYRLIYKSIIVRIPISVSLELESRPAPHWSRTFMATIVAVTSVMLMPPVGLINSEGNNLFIGNRL
jgi:hypothetical protein